MSTSLKKLLLVSITLLLGVMSDGVMASPPTTTNYDFSASLSTGGTITAVFTADNSQTYYSGTVNPFTNVSSLVDNGSAAVAYFPYSSMDSGATFTQYGVLGINGNLHVGSSMIFTNSSGQYVALAMNNFNGVGDFTGTGNYGVYTSLSLAQTAIATNAIATSSVALTNVGWGVSSGAPEIDGSLAPKVGFLLGCLFLMFGRKKQNTEPMLTA